MQSRDGKKKIKSIKAMQMKEKTKKVTFSERLKDWTQKIKWEVEVDKMNRKWPWGRITINAAPFFVQQVVLKPFDIHLSVPFLSGDLWLSSC